MSNRRYGRDVDMRQPSVMKTDRYVHGAMVVDGNRGWELLVACARGDLEAARQLVDLDIKLVQTEFWYQRPLNFAVRSGNPALVDFLLQMLKSIRPRELHFGFDGWPDLLSESSRRGDVEVHRLLVEYLQTEFSFDPRFEMVCEAIQRFDLQSVLKLLSDDTSLLNVADARGNTALHWAVMTRQVQMITALVQAGASLEARRADGQTPLLLAANGCRDYWYRESRRADYPTCRNSWVLVGLLLGHGADYELSVAAAVGDLKRVEQYIASKDIPASILDTARLSPLTYAARGGHEAVVASLLDWGVDPNEPEEGAPKGRALFEACAHNHLEIVERLLRAQADPNGDVDSCGCCLTISETCHGEAGRDVRDRLLKAGAKTPPYAMNTAMLQRVAVSPAEVDEHPELMGNVMKLDDDRLVIRFLQSRPYLINGMIHHGAWCLPANPEVLPAMIEIGFDVNAVDWLGRTPLHAAVATRRPAWVAALLRAGADVDPRDAMESERPLATLFREALGLQISVESGQSDVHAIRQISRLLLKHGSPVDSSDDPAWASPRSWAEQHPESTFQQMLDEPIYP